MMNNKTTASLPLRVSETVSVLEQQILGNIKREGAGQFENVVQAPVAPKPKTKRAKKVKE